MGKGIFRKNLKLTISWKGFWLAVTFLTMPFLFCSPAFAVSGGSQPTVVVPVGFMEFPIPPAGNIWPAGITSGPDGNLWFTVNNACRIGRITPTGTITEFPTDGWPVGITSGSDGNMWFTEFNGGFNKIGRITPTGVITEFPIPTAFGSFNEITSGPDGNLWFTEPDVNQIGRITPTGTITEFLVPTAGSYPWGITSGPDGNIWFTESNANHIGRITTDGVIKEFLITTAGSGPWGITSGPDGNIWFNEYSANQIGNITPSGVVTEFPITGSGPQGITLGPDGNIWFTEEGGGYPHADAPPQIGRITPTGLVTEFPILAAGSNPWEIISGPDGNIWFTETGNVNKIGRITPGGAGTELMLQPGSGPTDIALGLNGYLWFTASNANYIGSITSGGVISEFLTPTANSSPQGITLGTDSNLWFTESNANQIGRITSGGTVTELALPTANSGPQGITSGADGNLWFTEYGGNKIGRITTDGVITEFSIPTAGSGPWGITFGPDGNLWFTERIANKIGRITPDGVITEFVIPTANGAPTGITLGPDGSLWFTEYGGNNIGRITPAGAVTEFPIPTANSGPWGIISGADGNLWFTEKNVSKIGGITPSGVIAEFLTPTANSSPQGITLGTDGNLWFAEGVANHIGHIVLATAITEYTTPTVDSQPTRITSGPDGNLWFTENNAFQIGRITPDGTITEFPTAYGEPASITSGPDGNLWFTESGNAIGRITPGGVADIFLTSTSDSQTFGITSGPDGNLWFTEFGGNNIGRKTPDGTITEFPLPTAHSYPMGITSGPDGNLWFSEQCNKIGRITPDGVITEFLISRSCRELAGGITSGPDGNLWFTEQHAIGRITTGGAITEFSHPSFASGTLQDITSGPDGNLWFTEYVLKDSQVFFSEIFIVGRITPSGAITLFTLPIGSSYYNGIILGPDGNLWFTESWASQIGRITPPYTVTFKPNIYSLTVNIDPSSTGSGTVGGSGTFGSGTTHQVTAIANAGSTFSGWSGDCSGAASPFDVTMLNRNTTCTATFTLLNFTDNGQTMTDTITGLEWPKDGGTPTYLSCAGGPLNWNDAFIYVSCLNANNYLGHNDWRLPNITELQRIPNGGPGSFSTYAAWLNSLGFSNVQSYFYWSSTAFADDSRYAWFVSMWDGYVLYGNKAVDSYIWPVRGGQAGTFGTLTIQKAGTGSGTVTSSPSGISCGTYCSSSYSGLDVVLTATPDTGFTFSGWSGDAGCSGGTVSITGNINCTATFTLNQYSLTVNKTGAGNGTVGGGGTYDYGTKHDITAKASTGSTFTGWSGDCTGSTSPLSVTMLNRDMTCTATFIITVPNPPIVSATTPTKNTKPTWTWASGGNGGNGTFRYRMDNPVLTTGATTTTVRSYTPGTALSAGSHTCYVQEKNAAGLWSATGSMTVLIDTTAPVTTNNAPITWVNSGSITVTLNATDNAGGSGVATTKYCSPSSTCTPTTVGNSVTLACANGSFCSQTIRYYSTDNAGNIEATKSVLIRQDLTLPKDGTMTATPGSGKITLTWTAASDAGSGLAATNKYKVVKATGSAPANCSGTALYTGNLLTFTDTAVVNDQSYGYRVCATDAVGNVSVGVTATAIMPSITVTSPNGGEILTRGNLIPITWNYTGNPGTYVKIELFKSGVFNRTITSYTSKGTGGVGSYNWTIPVAQSLGSDYTVKVSSTTLTAVSDSSNTTFAISP